MKKLCIGIFTVRHSDITADLRPASWPAHMKSEYGIFRSGILTVLVMVKTLDGLRYPGVPLIFVETVFSGSFHGL